MKVSIQLAAISALCATGSLSMGAAWTGGTDNDWLTGSNWVGSDAPDTNAETATFNASVTNNLPNLTSATTIGLLEYQSGAGAYTIGGSQLTIQRTSGTYISHDAGNTQVISSNVILNSTSSGGRTVSVSAGSTITFAGSLTANGGSDQNVSVSGGGVMNIAGGFSGNQIQQGASTTVNVNSGVSSGVYFSTDNTGRINFNATTSRTAGAGSSSSGSGRIFITTDGVALTGTSGSSTVFRGGNSADSTIGADIAGGGTATINELRPNASRTNATYRIHSSASNVLIVNNLSLNSGTGSGTIYNIQGGGIVRFAGASSNGSATPIVVDTATLELNKSAGDAIGSSVALTVNSGGTVKLLASDQINDAVATTLEGVLNTNGFNEGVGALTLAGSPSIDLGAGASVLTFASLANFGTSLTINNWSGLISGGGTDQIIFSNTAGWTAPRLAAVTFTGYGAGAQLVGNELVPVPEPTSIALLGLSGLLLRRRRI